MRLIVLFFITLVFPTNLWADEAAEKQLDRGKLWEVIDDMIPNCVSTVSSSTDPKDMVKCEISNWPQTRAVYAALAERFRQNSWDGQRYFASGEWGAEFVTYALGKAGLTVKQDLSLSGFPPRPITKLNTAGKLGYCIGQKNRSSKVYVKYIHETFNPRPGDVIFYYGKPTANKSYQGCNCAIDQYPFWGNASRSRCALYCATQAGLVVGKKDSSLVIVEGNKSGKVRLTTLNNYNGSSSRLAGFGRINQSALDCRGL